MKQFYLYFNIFFHTDLALFLTDIETSVISSFPFSFYIFIFLKRLRYKNTHTQSGNNRIRINEIAICR